MQRDSRCRVRHGRDDCKGVPGPGRARHEDRRARCREAQALRGRKWLPVCIPSLDLVEIGAGGGSIAWIDELGILQVGPQSAGAEPGPACYQGGGTEPTVTDADVVLGYLDPEYFAGGTIELDPELSRKAITEHVLARTARRM